MLLPDISSLGVITDSLPSLGSLSSGSQWTGPAAAVLGLSIARKMLFRGLGLFPLMAMVGFMIFADSDARSLVSGTPNPLSGSVLPSQSSLLDNPAALVVIVGVGLLFLTGGRFISLPQLLLFAAGAALYFNPPTQFQTFAASWGLSSQTLVLLGAGVVGIFWFLQRNRMYSYRYPGMWAHAIRSNTGLFKSLFNGAGIVLVVGLASVLLVDRSLLLKVTPSVRVFLAPIALACGLTYLHRALPEKYKRTVTPLFWALACLVIGYELLSHPHPLHAAVLTPPGGAHF